jgi:hypothetical protein
MDVELMTPRVVVASVALGIVGHLAHLGNPVPEIAHGVLVEPPSDHTITGEVSWYCKANVSPCTRGYEPGAMVGAACGKLRRALGDWRGQQVVVKRGDRRVRVTLVDKCANQSRLIDLYWYPMHLLGGSGILKVTVAW